jgi:pimeloyl-ACP methyl ester carboxylesterase
MFGPLAGDRTSVLTMRWSVVLSALLSIGCHRATVVDTNVPVGSSSLHLVCRGEGKPVVVLDSGLGNDARVWSTVQTEVAQTTQVCAYDRAGLGASGPAVRPHTNLMMAEELSALLRTANVPGPYVLVGHSMGGVNVRLFERAHAAAVAGMVLVDSMSESQPAEFWALIPETDMAMFRTGVGKLPEGMDFEILSRGLSELETAKSIGKKPLVVLSHDVEDAPPGATPETAARLRAAWQRMQERLSHLSTNRAYVVVEGTRHVIQLERPRAVAVAIREVVGAVREHRSVDETPILAASK